MLKKLCSLRKESGGQVQAIRVLISAVIMLVVGIIVISRVFIGVPLTGTTTYTDHTLLNTGFTENTALKLNSWDNRVENGGVVTDGGDYVLCSTTENDTVRDNVILTQALTISGNYTGTTSAHLVFKYRMINDNGADNVHVKAYLDDGENNLIYTSDNLRENQASYVSVNEDVSDYITATGVYRVYIRVEMKGIMQTNIQVGIDDANLAVRTNYVYIDPDAQNAYDNTRTMAWVAIGLMSIGILMLGAMTIMSFMGGTKGKV